MPERHGVLSYCFYYCSRTQCFLLKRQDQICLSALRGTLFCLFILFLRPPVLKFKLSATDPHTRKRYCRPKLPPGSPNTLTMMQFQIRALHGASISYASCGINARVQQLLLSTRSQRHAAICSTTWLFSLFVLHASPSLLFLLVFFPITVPVID